MGQVGLASKLANRVLVINRGEVTDDGSPEVVISKMMANQAAKRGKSRQTQALTQAQPNKGRPNVI